MTPPCPALPGKVRSIMSKMIAYIGTKMIHAVPAEKIVLAGNDKAVVVEHGSPDFEYMRELPIISREDGYKVRYADGYESWSPKDVFEEAYRPTNAMNFGLAIEAAKKGKKIARKNWNGKGQYVFLAHGVEFHTNADLSAFADTDVEVHDLLVIKTSQDIFQPGWLATQSDILADDWYIVE